jgi:hypothetical protein
LRKNIEKSRKVEDKDPIEKGRATVIASASGFNIRVGKSIRRNPVQTESENP